MKKILAVVLVLVMAFMLCGCCLKHEFAPATCTEPETCTKCGKTQGEALGHKWQDADCTEPKTCSVCGETEGEALGHDWTEATCTEPKTCTVCGATEGEALGHDWAEATCTEPKTCTVCGATEGEEAGHEWAEATCTEPKTCTVCGATEGEASGHEWAEATCTEPKTCTVCGETEGAALGHTGEAVAAVKPTCTETGLTQGRVCTVCGEILIAQKEIPALGHSWADATMLEPKTCSVCGETEGKAIKDEAAVVINGTDYSVGYMNYAGAATYYDFLANYGGYAALFGLDTSLPLSEQECGVSDDAGTWEDYFKNEAVATVKVNRALLDYAEENGISLTEEETREISDYIDSYEEYLVSYAFENFDAALEELYGPYAEKEYLVSDSVNDAVVQRAYSSRFNEILDSLTEEDIADCPRIDARHVLIMAEPDEDGISYSQEALDRAEYRAEAVLRIFERGDMTEDSFAELAKLYSEDQGSAEAGGLYTAVAPGQMVEEFDAFCFDEARQPGDTAIVYGTNGAYAGYHVMYFVGDNTDASYNEVANAKINEWFEQLITSAEVEKTEYFDFVSIEA
ncbi:MAG: peptidylprolyl isomerase [Eubacteriales bacterium]|nr:peptidylprolyl isomerase [Eubacteriales bacterium]